ncbi:MAG: S41 family peptidase [Acidobacteria bacterium]|nr:S41 family peptidase [Acidobacteriota bacterium]
MATHRRSLYLAPLIVVFGAVAGGFLGRGPGVAAAPASQDDVKTSIQTFTRVFDVVERNAAAPVAADKAIFKGAIPGMLRTLDPHSGFYDPRDFRVLREDQQGHYYGVGMSVTERNGKTIVIAPFAGSPAYRAGIRPGDTILVVNDKSTEGLNSAEVADLLKGQKGTPVQVTVGREGHDTPLTFNLVRDEIPRKSVNDAFFVRPGIAHLDIESFNENTGREVEENLKRLGEQNIKGLILDLRENPGGLLTEGVAVAGRFLHPGQTVVSHRGRSSPEKPYLARNGSSSRDYPIVVLVNRYSASAAEIVAGALQDHDRAWVIGENTFGKGLVQTVYPLSENTGLALTTAKYYTPSGRLIQFDYSAKSFLDYYYRKDLDAKNPQDVKMTDGGRTVYGGGGIAPDEKSAGRALTRFQRDLLRRFAFFNFTARTFGQRDLKIAPGWEPDNEVMNAFHRFLLDGGVEFTEAEFAEVQDWLKLQVRREFYLTGLGVEQSRRLSVETDPMVLQAIEALPKAKELLENAKKMIVQRTARQPRP